MLQDGRGRSKPENRPRKGLDPEVLDLPPRQEMLLDDAVHVLFSALDGYTTDLPLSDCMREQVLFAWDYDGEALEAGHGGPLRVVTPQKYAYKGAKWVDSVEFLTEPERGYWEKRGYSQTANPWREQRYS